MTSVRLEQLLPILKRHVSKVCLVDENMEETVDEHKAFAIRFGGSECRLYADADYVVLK
jgi:hypothetical protein